MLHAQPQVLEFLANRRSRPAKTLVEPAPDRAALAPILEMALRVPDHGKLEPWRLIILEGDAMGRLADLAAARAGALGFEPERVEKTAVMFRDAPMMVAVISAPVESEKVPVAEQVLSAGAVCLSLVNAALASGWGANWLTGPLAFDAIFTADGLELAASEQVAGFVVLGTETKAPPERPRPDVTAKVSWVTS